MILITEGMDGGEILLQRVGHSGIKRQYELNEANFMFYSKLLSVQYRRIYNKRNLCKKIISSSLRSVSTKVPASRTICRLTNINGIFANLKGVP